MTRSTHRLPFSIRIGSWCQDNNALRFVRNQVFIKEQGVPVELEWDELDKSAIHLLAEDVDGRPIATARLLTDGHIGRVAVLKPWRHLGVGSAVMGFALELAAKHGFSRVHLDAQVEAIPFYTHLGFIAEGEAFLDAGILHRHMWCQLEDSSSNG